MKIAICTPSHGMVHSDFTVSLTRMVAHTLQSRIVFNGAEVIPSIELFMRSGSMLPTVRNNLVQDALEWKANFLLWTDADHTFPPDSLMRLLSLNLPVVGVNYARRTSPTYPTAIAPDDTFVWTTLDMARNREISEVRSLGLGLCLIDITVFVTLHEHATAAGKENFWPLFCFEPIPGHLDVVGEDTFFFKRLKEAGIRSYVDHALSWSVDHIHQRRLTNADTLTDKAAFLEKYPPEPNA